MYKLNYFKSLSKQFSSKCKWETLILYVLLLEDLGILNSLTKPFLTSSHVGDGNSS